MPTGTSSLFLITSPQAHMKIEVLTQMKMIDLKCIEVKPVATTRFRYGRPVETVSQ